jgi:hypothetical protein
MIKNQTKNIFILIVVSIALFFATQVLASDSNGTIDPSYKYAWGENLGWLNFGCDGCTVHVTDTGLIGHVWSRQYGWVNLSPSTTTHVTNSCTGQLGGYAWSSNLGWINFTGASIDFTGKFTGIAGTLGSQTGRVRFNCDNCDVRTDWRQCAIRPSPPQVVINLITNNVVPTIVASTTLTNEGTVGAEYPYEWCVVSDINNECGGGDDVFYSSASKFLNPGESFYTSLNATVPTPGNYYFKLVAHWQDQRSVASISFTAVAAGIPTSEGGGGGSYFPPYESPICDGADFNHDGYVNSIDFSIMLYYWKTNPPYKNICVDINKDRKVDPVDFSIMLSQWGKRSVK